MLIPIRCFTCGNVIGDKWKPFVQECVARKNKFNETINSELDIDYINIRKDGKIKKSMRKSYSFE